MKPALFVLLFTLFSFIGTAQQLTGIITQWNDSFAEWIIFTEIEGEEGHLKLSWNSGDDWTRWEYRIGEWAGQIRAKWPNRFDVWEVRGENVIIDARAMWRDNPREWRITNPSGYAYKWKSRFGNTREEWIIVNKEEQGYFEMYTAFEGDLREWIIIDELDASLPEKMMLVFLTIINSTPKL